jgi:hypothetical protein
MTSKPTPGIVERHSRSCPSRHGGRCVKPECTPRFEAWVWSPKDRKKIARVRNARSGEGVASRRPLRSGPREAARTDSDDRLAGGTGVG